jgi:hypothetical protein
LNSLLIFFTHYLMVGEKLAGGSMLRYGMSVTRRSFVSSLAAAPLWTAAPARKRILILGGTGFLGPATVEAATARGHELTLFNRGRGPACSPKSKPSSAIATRKRARA